MSFRRGLFGLVVLGIACSSTAAPLVDRASTSATTSTAAVLVVDDLVTLRVVALPMVNEIRLPAFDNPVHVQKLRSEQSREQQLPAPYKPVSVAERRAPAHYLRL